LREASARDTGVSFEIRQTTVGMQHVTGLSRPGPDDAPEAHRGSASRRQVLGALGLGLLPDPLWLGAPAAASALTPALSPAAGAEPVRIVFDVQENPPLICGTGTAIDPDRPGLTIELLRMASERAGIAIALSRTPWQRGLYLVETGQADAIFASSYVQERLRYGVYPLHDGHPDTRRKLFDQSYRLYVRAGSSIGWDGKTLTNLHAPVGATTGYAVVPALRAMGVAVEEEPSHIANLRKLAAGRLDAYAELDNHVRPLLRNDPAAFGGIVELSPPVRTTAYYLMFSRIFYARAAEIAERIWDAIAVVNASAAYQDLLLGSKYAD
jgi:polar amino acid transport system substrate-binding protein